MKFEHRMRDALQVLGDMAGWVPPWLWWTVAVIAICMLGLTIAVRRWSFVAAFIRMVDAINERVGRATAWIMLFLVLVTFLSVVLRYAFDTGWVWMADLAQWPHGAAFMLAAGYTLLHEGHVRVDIFYSVASTRRRAWTDLIGVLVFLLPWIVYLVWVIFPAVAFSWRFLESSTEPGGLPARYLMKTSAAAFTILLGAQGLALAGRSLLTLVGREDLLPTPARVSSETQ